MSPRIEKNRHLVSHQLKKKHVTSMSCKLEPAIWSRDTGQRIPCSGRCQLIMVWMSNIKEVHSKPRLHVSVNLFLEYGRHVARLRRRRRRRAYAPTSITASHDNHVEINSWVSFSFLYEYWAYPGFRSMKRLGVFLLPPGWDASPSSSMTLHLNQNSSILLTTYCKHLPAEKLANPTLNMYLQMAKCARKTNARYANNKKQ